MERFKVLTYVAWTCWFLGAILCATSLFTQFGILLLMFGGVAMAVRGKKGQDKT